MRKPWVQDSYLPRLYGRGTMSQIYRSSRFIDFNEGRVILDPESFVDQVSRPWTLEQKIDFFECRVDVWQLGVAVEMLKQIEAHEPPSIWSHAAYGLLSVIASYFEMVGKVLNPRSGPSRTSSVDFNWGFCNVYRRLSSRSGDITRLGGGLPGFGRS